MISLQKLEGSVVVVTGAGRGLGAALAISLAEVGSRPILCGRRREALEGVASTILERAGLQAKLVELDLGDAASVARAVAQLKAEHEVVDILINNGAMWLERSEEDHHPEEVLGVVNAAVSGTFLLTQGLMPLLHGSVRPDIVTIGSIGGLPNAAIQTVSVPFYAAKRAQAALAEGLAQMLVGTPVRSPVVHPPYLEDIEPGGEAWESASQRRKGERATNRDIVDAVLLAVTRPRHVSLSIIVDADEGGRFSSTQA
ncbi:putative oxidoreductase [compost metagenome]